MRTQWRSLERCHNDDDALRPVQRPTNIIPTHGTYITPILLRTPYVVKTFPPQNISRDCNGSWKSSLPLGRSFSTTEYLSCTSEAHRSPTARTGLVGLDSEHKVVDSRSDSCSSDRLFCGLRITNWAVNDSWKWSSSSRLMRRAGSGCRIVRSSGKKEKNDCFVDRFTLRRRRRRYTTR